MRIERVELHEVSVATPPGWRTALGKPAPEIPRILVALSHGDAIGWGEVVAGTVPAFSGEYVDSAWMVLERFVLPPLVGRELREPEALEQLSCWRRIRGNHMAKAAVEVAVWDLIGQCQGFNVGERLGGTRRAVPIGTSVGLQPDIETLLEVVDRRVKRGYRRIKCKIEPGHALAPIRAVREHFPDIELSVDANGSFGRDDVAIFEGLDELSLAMIEQPLGPHDLVGHASLQRRLRTAICLDESITSAAHAETAIALGACRIVNVKIGRLGGLGEALRVARACEAAGVELWCGGMLETPIGRYAGLNLATLPSFGRPHDIAPHLQGEGRDGFAGPALTMVDGMLAAPSGPGLGLDVDYRFIERRRRRRFRLGHREGVPILSPRAWAAGVEESRPDPAAPLPRRDMEPLTAAFERVARAHPERVAIEHGSLRLGYGELERLTEDLARALVALGTTERVVAIHGRPRPALVVAMLAVLRAGAAYLVLPHQLPEAEWRARWGQARPAVLLVLEGSTPPSAAMLAFVDAPIVAISEALEWPGLRNTARAASLPRIPASALAYVLFTSGTTGVPKGILGDHGPPVHFLEWQRRRFELSPDDRFAMLAGIGHDIILRDIFAPLSVGAVLCIPEDERGIVEALGSWLDEHRITVAHLTPLRGRLLTRAERTLSSLRLLFFGGDHLRPELVSLLERAAPHATIVNCYGTSETPQVMAFDVVHRGGSLERSEVDTCPIGRGIEGVQLLVLDEDDRLAPCGEPGEIVVRSPYLARGYLGRCELTARRFTANPLGAREDHDDRVYRTGDWGRYLPDGRVELLGRMDRQLELRGARIEPTAIEHALERLPGVARAWIGVAGKTEVDQQLVAYVARAPGAELPARDDEAATVLRRALVGTLSSTTMPDRILFVSEIPLTANGKVDVAALGRMADAPALAEPPREPRTATERALAEIWAELLDCPKPHLGDDFFALGGNSLMAMELLIRIEAVFGISLASHEPWVSPTLAGLSVVLERSRATEPLASEAGSSTEGLRPLCSGQARLVRWQQRTGSLVSPKVTSHQRLRGPLDAELLVRTFDTLRARHRALRTTIVEVEGQPMARDDDEPGAAVRFEAVEGGSEQDVLATLDERLHADVSRPFALGEEPLVRAKLWRLGPFDHVLGLAFHHAILDGWSRKVLMREWSELYRAAVEGHAPAIASRAPEPDQLVAWQQRQEFARTRDPLVFWRPYLRALPAAPTVGVGSPAAPIARHTRTEVEAASMAQLEQVARRRGTSPFVLLLATLTLTLHEVLGLDRVTVGFPHANRSRRELEGMVGHLSNPLMLSMELGTERRLSSVVERVAELVPQLFSWHEVPFEWLLEKLRPDWAACHELPFTAWLNLNISVDRLLTLPGVAVSKHPVRSSPRPALHDLSVGVMVGRDGDASTRMSWTYRESRHSEETVLAIAGRWRALLRQLTHTS